MSPTKLTLNPSQDIPFNKLRLSQANVRRVKVGLSIEALAEDLARRGLLQSLNVRPALHEGGAKRHFSSLRIDLCQTRPLRHSP